MDDARQRTGEAGDGRDGLDVLIDRALEQMRIGEPIDVRSHVLARLDGDAGAAGKRGAVWRPAVAVGAIALVAAVAVTMIPRREVQPAGRIADSRSATAQPQPGEVAARVPADPARTERPVAIRPARSLPNARRASMMGDASASGPNDEPAEAQQVAETTLPGAPVGNPGEPIPVMPGPPPVVIPAIVPVPIALVPSVVDVGTPVGILPIVEPAWGTTDPGKNGRISP